MEPHHDESSASSTNDDCGSELGQPVVVMTEELLAKMAEEEKQARGTDPNIFISPFGDESVQGYRDDKEPPKHGLGEITAVVRILDEARIPCCMVAEPALLYYGTTRVMVEWIMCVPDDLVNQAADQFLERSDEFEKFRPPALKRVRGMEDLYPRFKFVGLRLFFILMSSKAWHIQCKPENIEYSGLGIPFPKLSVYAQGLLDSRNWVDLEDLIDGMNLTPEWGEENLDLSGTISSDFGLWSSAALYKIPLEDLPPDRVPGWCRNPPVRLESWIKMSSDEAKKTRQGFKYNPGYETRFWRRGQKDPRTRWERPT